MADKTYTVVASGNTFPIREDLKSWAFQWDQEKKVWKRDCVSEFERRCFEGERDDGSWDGVELEFEEEKREEWEKHLDELGSDAFKRGE